MIETGKAGMALVLATCGLAGWACNLAAAAVHIEGQVQAGGGPLANSVVTLWAANAGDPKQLAQTQTGIVAMSVVRPFETELRTFTKRRERPRAAIKVAT